MISGKKETFDWWGIAEVIVILAGSIFPRKEQEDWGLILAKEDRVWRS